MEKLKRRLAIIGANRFNSKRGLDSNLKHSGLLVETGTGFTSKSIGGGL